MSLGFQAIGRRETTHSMAARGTTINGRKINQICFPFGFCMHELDLNAPAEAWP